MGTLEDAGSPKTGVTGGCKPSDTDCRVSSRELMWILGTSSAPL